MQLACVVGHEAAHIVMFHHAERNFWDSFIGDTADEVLIPASLHLVLYNEPSTLGPGIWTLLLPSPQPTRS